MKLRIAILVVILLVILVPPARADSCTRPFVGRWFWYNRYVISDGQASLYGGWVTGRRYADVCEAVQAEHRPSSTELYFRIVTVDGTHSRLWVRSAEIRWR